MKTSRFKVSLHPTQFREKPKDPKAIGKVSKELGGFPVEVTLDELATAIGRGQTYSVGTFTNGYRKIENLQQVQLVGLDIDKGNLSRDNITNRLTHCGVTPNLLGPTFSSTEQDKKWRVIICLSEALQDPLTYSQVTKYLIRVLGGDKATTDACRLFFGSNIEPEVLSYVLNDTLGLVERAKALASLLPSQSVEEVRDININPGNTDFGLGFNIARGDCFRWMFKNLPASERELAMMIDKDCLVAMSDPVTAYGSGYSTLWNVARKLAQCSAFSDAYIVLFLAEFINKYEDEWTDCQHLDRIDEIADNAIEFGRNTLRF